MKRRIVTTAVFLVVGAVVTVAVAWSAVLLWSKIGVAASKDHQRDRMILDGGWPLSALRAEIGFDTNTGLFPHFPAGQCFVSPSTLISRSCSYEIPYSRASSSWYC